MGMMLHYKVSDRLSVDLEVKEIKQAFRALSVMDQVLGVKQCGNCGGEHLSFKHTQPKGYDYYSMACDDCGHELKFGQAKDSDRLFAKGWEPPYEGGKSDGGGSDEPQTSNAGEGDSDIPW